MASATAVTASAGTPMACAARARSTWATTAASPHPTTTARCRWRSARHWEPPRSSARSSPGRIPGRNHEPRPLAALRGAGRLRLTVELGSLADLEPALAAEERCEVYAVDGRTVAHGHACQRRQRRGEADRAGHEQAHHPAHHRRGNAPLDPGNAQQVDVPERDPGDEELDLLAWLAERGFSVPDPIVVVGAVTVLVARRLVSPGLWAWTWAPSTSSPSPSTRASSGRA